MSEDAKQEHLLKDGDFQAAEKAIIENAFLALRWHIHEDKKRTKQPTSLTASLPRCPPASAAVHVQVRHQSRQSQPQQSAAYPPPPGTARCPSSALAAAAGAAAAGWGDTLSCAR